MNKTLLSSVALAFALGISSAAMADERRDPGDISASPADNAQCDTGAGSGAFGYLSGDYNPSNPDLFGSDTDPLNTRVGDGKPGVNGKIRTGPKNAAVCGNRPD